MNYLLITDVFRTIGTPCEDQRRWGKVVVQVPSVKGDKLESVTAIARLIANKAAAKKWPGIIRLRDAEKLVLESCDWGIEALGEPFYEDSLGKVWIIDPTVGSSPLQFGRE